MLKRGLLIILLIIPIHSALATDFYVATTGSDSTGDGSASNPWATIDYAVSQLPSSGGDTIIVKDGHYEGGARISESFDYWITIRAENDFGAKLTNIESGAPVFYIYTGGSAKIIIEGFIISNAHPTYDCNGREDEYLVHFQDTDDLILQNNIIYGNNAPGTCNEIIKINRGSEQYYPSNIHIRRNVLYDPASAGGSDIIDSVRPGELDIYENIFFSRGSKDSQSFITLKREVQNQDIPIAYKPARNPRHKIYKNIFLNWDGKDDQAFIQLGEDGYNEYMITNSLIENNLFIGNSNNEIVAPIQLKGAENITVRANTVVGNLPGSRYGFRIGTEVNNPDIKGFFIYNNIFSDYTGTMSPFANVYEVAGSVDRSTIDLDNNLFWNNGNVIPTTGDIQPASDINRIEEDPLLETDQSNVILPVWDEYKGEFLSGSKTIREEFERLANTYCSLGKGSPAIDKANPSNMPDDDILGNPRDDKPDIGAFEYQEEGIQKATLYGFDTGGPLECSGSSPNIICTDKNKMDGWSYLANCKSGRGGFRKDSDNNFMIFWGNYAGDQGWLEVDNTRGAKGTSGSLKIRTTGTGNDGIITKKEDELNYPDRVGDSPGGLPYFDFFTNGKHYPELQGKFRISAYVWIPINMKHYKSYNGWNDYNWHMGTYVCPQDDDPCITRSSCTPYSPGEPCDGSNGHFYHHYTLGQWGGGGWVKLIIDQNPQHKRNVGNPDYNPSQEMFGEDYVPSLNRIYMQLTGRGGKLNISVPIDIWVDEIEAYSRDYYAETDQNEFTISSPAIGYYPNGDGHWEMSWDSELTKYGTYEIKYSLTEFTNENFDTNGQHITPLENAATGGDGLVGKLHKDDYSFSRYSTYFNLSSQYEQPGTRVYFAIRDVSAEGEHGTAELDWATDERTSQDDRIYAFSYVVSDSLTIECGNGICNAGETCSSCPGDCIKAHETDTNPCDGCLDTTELRNYIKDWLEGKGSLRKTVDAIRVWKHGCQ